MKCKGNFTFTLYSYFFQKETTGFLSLLIFCTSLYLFPLTGTRVEIFWYCGTPQCVLIFVTLEQFSFLCSFSHLSMGRTNPVGLLGNTFPILLWESYGDTTLFTQSRSYTFPAWVSHAETILITEQPNRLVNHICPVRTCSEWSDRSLMLD